MNPVLKEAIAAGLTGAAIAAALSFAVNMFLTPMPGTLFEHALGNGISGFFSGLMSGFIGVYLALKKFSASSQAKSETQTI